MNCMLKTGTLRWGSAYGLEEIPAKAWGVMDAKTLASQLDKCIPVPIWCGETRLGANSHDVVIVGYELKNEEPDEEMDLIIANPSYVITGSAEWRTTNLKYSDLFSFYGGWKQSLYILHPPKFGHDCKTYN